MTAQTLIEKVTDLPSPSPSALRLITSLNRPDTDPDEIVRVVEQDPVLSAKLLAVCNSAAVGASQPVASTKQAVFYLGYREIYRLVMAISFGGALGRVLSGHAMRDRELWRHSLVTALATQAVLAEARAADFEPSIAYTAGLVHDIGKIVLNEVLDFDTQAKLRDRIERDHRSRLEAERDVLHTDHAEVGAALLRRWRLPDLLVEAVADHHQPITSPRPQLSAVVHVANCVAHQVGSAPGWHAYALPGYRPRALPFEAGADFIRLFLRRTGGAVFVSGQSVCHQSIRRPGPSGAGSSSARPRCWPGRWARSCRWGRAWPRSSIPCGANPPAAAS
jgi:putative nucleotidyltransferase with HDIG domain